MELHLEVAAYNSDNPKTQACVVVSLFQAIVHASSRDVRKPKHAIDPKKQQYEQRSRHTVKMRYRRIIYLDAVLPILETVESMARIGWSV